MNSATHREVGAALSDLVLQTLAQVGHQGPQVRLLQRCPDLSLRVAAHRVQVQSQGPGEQDDSFVAGREER